MTYKAEVITDGPIRYWRFDEDSGAFHTTYGTDSGTTLGTPRRTRPGVGDGEYAIEFPTVNDYVQMGAVGTIPQVSKRNSFSWECWFRCDDVGTPSSGILAHQLIGTNCWVDAFSKCSWATIMRLASGNDNGKIEVHAAVGSVEVVVKSPVLMDDDIWHHVVGTFNGTTLSLYTDGVLRGTAAVSGAVNAGINPPVVGHMYESDTNATLYPPNAFAGMIDEVAVYETVLSAARIKKHYDEGIKQFVKWYQFDGTNEIRLTPTQYTGSTEVALTSHYQPVSVVESGYGVIPGSNLTLFTPAIAAASYPGNAFMDNYRYKILKSGTYSNYRFEYRVEVNTGNVTFYNCHFAGAPGDTTTTDVALINCLTTGTGKASLTRCTLIPLVKYAGIDGVRGQQLTIDGCEISGTVDGGQLWGTGGTTIKNTWVHDMKWYAPPAGPDDAGTHNDCFQISSGVDYIFQNNLFSGTITSIGLLFTQGQGTTGDILIDGNTFDLTGNGADVGFKDWNHPSGAVAIQNVTVSNNKFKKDLGKYQIHPTTLTFDHPSNVFVPNAWIDGSAPPARGWTIEDVWP